jgi:heme-degrading monooxygenase HmoA
LFVSRARGLQAVWRGRKFEDRYTLVYLLLWENLESSHAFFTSAAYKEFNSKIQPALNGRKIKWNQHTLVGSSSTLNDKSRLKSILSSPAVEVALTKVVEGGVAGYYEKFEKVVSPILKEEPGCDGFFISPQVENPQDQILLINWKSVDVSWPAVQITAMITDMYRLIMKDLRRSRGLKLALMPFSITMPSSWFRGISWS